MQSWRDTERENEEAWHSKAVCLAAIAPCSECGGEGRQTEIVFVVGDADLTLD